LDFVDFLSHNSWDKIGKVRTKFYKLDIVVFEVFIFFFKHGVFVEFFGECGSVEFYFAFDDIVVIIENLRIKVGDFIYEFMAFKKFNDFFFEVNFYRSSNQEVFVFHDKEDCHKSKHNSNQDRTNTIKVEDSSSI